MREKTSKRSTWENLSWLIRKTLPIDRLVFVYIAMQAIFAAISKLVPVFFPPLIINELMGGKRIRTVLFIIAAMAGGTILSQALVHYFHNTLTPRIVHIRQNFYMALGRKYMTTSLENLETPAFNDLCDKAEYASYRDDYGVAGTLNALPGLINGVITVVVSVTVLTELHPLIIVGLLALAVVNYISNSQSRVFNFKQWDAITPYNRRHFSMMRMMGDFKAGKDERLYDLSDNILHNFMKNAMDRWPISASMFRSTEVMARVMAVTTLLQEAALYAYLVYRVAYTGMSIGDFTLYAAAVRTFSATLKELSDQLITVQHSSRFLGHYRDFVDAPEKDTGTAPVTADKAADYTLELRGVSFRYPGKKTWALRSLSCSFTTGQRIAIVGLNGSGKTTLIKLLMRLYDPTEGVILLNGTDISTLDKLSYYRLFSAAFQENHVFPLSILENVAMRDAQAADRPRTEECLRRAGLWSRVRSLKHGMDTPLLKVMDKEGVILSGGENQRLSFARALYKDAPVVVLDEPTAALDPIAEYELYSGFSDMLEGRLGIYISHRLSSTRFCDEVLFLEEGRITERGTHSQLLASGGGYASLFAMQAEHYQSGWKEELTGA